MQAPGDAVGELEEGERKVDAHGDPKLRQHGVAGCADGAPHPQALLDPLEKQLHLPSGLAGLGDGRGRQLEVGCQEDAAPAGVGVLEPDSAQRMGTALPAACAREFDGLVTGDAPPSEGRLDRVPLQHLVPDPLLHARHEEPSLQNQVVDPREVQVGPVRRDDAPLRQLQRPRRLNVRLPAFRDPMNAGKKPPWS